MLAWHRHPATGAQPGRSAIDPWLGVRALGALAVLAAGGIHLQQYIALYWAVPAIGTLFLLNVAGAAAVGMVLLTISEHTPIFGFMEPGYVPAAILASRVAEGAAVLLLGSYLVARFGAGWARARW